MFMNKTIVLLAGVCALLLSGCDYLGIRGNGHIVTDQRPISECAEIAASGVFRIEWHPGAPALTITTDENLLSYVESRVSEGTLRLRTRDRVRPTHGIKVSVSSRVLNGADL